MFGMTKVKRYLPPFVTNGPTSGMVVVIFLDSAHQRVIRTPGPLRRAVTFGMTKVYCNFALFATNNAPSLKALPSWRYFLRFGCPRIFLLSLDRRLAKSVTGERRPSWGFPVVVGILRPLVIVGRDSRSLKDDHGHANMDIIVNFIIVTQGTAIADALFCWRPHVCSNDTSLRCNTPPG
jgi:hypothetical protein